MNSQDKQKIKKQFNQNLTAIKQPDTKSAGSAEATFIINERFVAEATWFDHDEIGREQIQIYFAYPSHEMHPSGVFTGFLSNEKPFESGSYNLLEDNGFQFGLHYTAMASAEIKNGNATLTVTDEKIEGHITCDVAREGFELSTQIYFEVKKN